MLELWYYSLVIIVGTKQITLGRKQLQSIIKKVFRISEIVYLHN